MESSNFQYPQRNLNMIKLSAQPMQITTNYLPFYSPANKTLVYPMAKQAINQEIFKQQMLSPPKNLSCLLQKTSSQITNNKKPPETTLLNKVLNNGQNLLTQRDDPRKESYKINGSISERSVIDRKKWGSMNNIVKEQDSYEKENKNTINISKPMENIKNENKKNVLAERKPTISSSYLLQIPKKETKKPEFSQNLSKQEIISHENSEKFSFLNQRFEISKNLTQQTPKTNESGTPNEEKKVDYREFLHELHSHKNEIVDLKQQTKGLKDKVSFLESQLIESDRRKKLDELNELLNKANLENKLIRKKTKNRELKLNNYTQGEKESLRESKQIKVPATNTDVMKNKLEFKKLLQKTDLSKLISVVDCNAGKIKSERNSKNNEDLKSILDRRMSNDLNNKKGANYFKEDQKDEKKSAESNNVSESLNTLKKRLANFLNKYEGKKNNK